MKNILTLIFILFINQLTNAQQRFEKRLCRNPDPINSYCQMHGIVQMTNGNYITGGYNDYIHSLTGIDDVDALIFVTNSYGDTIKTHSFFPNDTSFFHQFNGRTIHIFQNFILNANKECIAVASIQGYGATNIFDCNILLVKLDSLGDTLLTKLISHPLPGDSGMIPYSVIQTFDGNYVISGSQYSFFSTRYIGFIMKVDTNFSVLWRKSFLNPNSNFFFSALESPDHGIFLSGSKFNPNDYTIVDPFLIKVDSAGNELWRNNYASVGPDYGGDITQLTDGNYFQVTTLNVGNDTSTYRIIKFANNGSVITSKNHLRTYANGMRIKRTVNNRLISGGWIENNHSTQTVDAFVMGIDNNGDSLWYRQYGGIWPDNAWDMAPTSDGGVILCGETYSNVIPNTNSNAWLLKLDSLGLLITGVNEQSWASAVQLSAPFPNPCNEQFSVSTSIPEGISNTGRGKTGNELQLYDMQSKPIKYIPVKEGSAITTFTTAHLAAGTYLLVLVVNGYNVKALKIIKE
jgi:hypothetical protein